MQCVIIIFCTEFEWDVKTVTQLTAAADAAGSNSKPRVTHCRFETQQAAYLTSVHSEALAVFVNIVMSTCISDDNSSNMDDLPALVEDNGQFAGVWYLPMVRIVPQLPFNTFNNALAVDVD